jgi:hypothetical protein
MYFTNLINLSKEIDMRSTKLILLFGTGLAGSFDLAMGIFIVIITAKIQHVDITLLIIAWGMFFAVLPDLDLLLDFVARIFWRDWGRMHKKSILHQPLPIFCLVFFQIYLFASPFLFWIIVAPLALLTHYLHDIEEEGEGVQLLAPFSLKRFLFLGGRLKILNPEEEKKYFAITNEEWINKSYLHWQLRPIIHGTLFVAAIITAMITIK